MNGIESALYEVSKFFLTPVLIVLSLMFLYALFVTGGLLLDLGLAAFGGQRRRALAAHAARNPGISQEQLELHLLKLLEPLRITSRVAPMLGLVATMIPMGPALIAVSAGNAQGMAQNLVVAFAAVVIALLAAALTFTVLSVRRRWLLGELNDIVNAAASGASHAPPAR